MRLLDILREDDAALGNMIEEYERKKREYKTTAERLVNKYSPQFGNTIHHYGVEQGPRIWWPPLTPDRNGTFLRVEGNPSTIANLVKASEKTRQLYKEVAALKKQINRMKTNQSGDFLLSKMEKDHKQIDPADVPKKLPSGKGKFNNPYYIYDNRYAGHPANFPFWTKPMEQLYYTLEKILEKYNIPGFTVMYTGYDKGGFEFAIYGAEDRLLWRKYGTGGAGQNWIYVDGERYNTSWLAHPHPSSPQPETILKPLIDEYNQKNQQVNPPVDI